MTEGPDADALGRVAADHLPPILYALEVCAVQMEQADRAEEASYYRELARLLAEAAGEGRVGEEE
jgi:hypothetical protein